MAMRLGIAFRELNPGPIHLFIVLINKGLVNPPFAVPPTPLLSKPQLFYAARPLSRLPFVLAAALHRAPAFTILAPPPPY
ncbi:hypothetical protein B0H19DRAFT_1275223 [Mycena capillaripes]|nr:hypothetical protein B0H19DRAFT_1275223 [Mycena capillaripes]